MCGKPVFYHVFDAFSHRFVHLFAKIVSINISFFKYFFKDVPKGFFSSNFLLWFPVLL